MIKKRSINELRQTKDCYYRVPKKTIRGRALSQNFTNRDVFECYRELMEEKGRVADIGMATFEAYLAKNSLCIVKK